MWEALIGAGVGLVGSAMSASAAKKAASQQQAATDQALSMQREMYDQGRKDLAPYRKTGKLANNELAFLLGIQGKTNPAVKEANNALKAAQARYDALLGSGGGGYWGPETTNESGDDYLPNVRGWIPGSSVDPGALRSAQRDLNRAQRAVSSAKGQPWEQPEGFGSLREKYTGQDLYDDPSYEFRLSEARKGLENSAAARGMQLSGANLKALDRYTQDYASNEFTAARNRFAGDQDQTYNYLTGPTQRGLSAASASANAAGQFGQTQAGLLTGAGNAQAAGTVGASNNMVSGLNNAANAYGQYSAQERLNAALRNIGADPDYNHDPSSGPGWFNAFRR